MELERFFIGAACLLRALAAIFAAFCKRGCKRESE